MKFSFDILSTVLAYYPSFEMLNATSLLLFVNGDQQVAEELSSAFAVIDLHSQCNGDYLLVFVLVCMLYVK